MPARAPAAALMATEVVEGDDVLVREHLDGADGAFEVLYHRYFPRLVRLCLASTRDRAAAEDAAQETLVRALIHLDRFDTARPLWPWLRAIARRLLIDQAKDRARELPVDDPGDEPEIVDLDFAHERPILLEALSNIPPRQRVAVALRYLEDWDPDQVARFMDLSGSAFRQILYRGRHKLREEYRRLTEGVTGLVLAPLGWLRRAGRRAARMQGAGGGASAASGIAFHLTAGIVAALVTAGAVVSSGSEGSTETTTPPGIAISHARGTADGRAPHGSGGGGGRPTGAASQDGADPSRIPGERQSQAREAVSDVTDPNRNVKQPEDAEILSIAYSPAFERDGTIFAAGVASCRIPLCPPVLFRSRDAGASWFRLEAHGFRGNQVLLPPAFGRGDRRIFALGPLGLQLSEDGGRTFSTPAPAMSSLGTGTAAISPAFHEGDPRILIGDQTLMQYRDDTGTVGPAEPVPGRGPFHPTFSPAYARDGIVLIGGVGFDASQMGWVSMVFRCEGTICSGTSLGPGEPPSLRIASDFRDSGLVYALTSTGLFKSTDDGSTFKGLPVPQGVSLQDATSLEVGRVLLATASIEGSDASSGGIYAWSDESRTWHRHPDPLLTDGVQQVRSVGEHVTVALIEGGIACSPDGGVTWARRCSA